jgi:hypothetical protein
LINRRGFARFCNDPLDRLRDPMIVGHRQRAVNRMIPRFSQHQAGQGRPVPQASHQPS